MAKKTGHRRSGDPRKSHPAPQRRTLADGTVAELRTFAPDMTPEQMAAVTPTCGTCGRQGRWLLTPGEAMEFFGPNPLPPPEGADYWGCDGCGSCGIAGFGLTT